MRAPIAFAIIVSVGASACILDPQRNKRPARLQMGTSARGFPTARTPAAQDGVAARSAEPVMDTSLAQVGAVTGSAQFTMATPHHLYLGGEIEAGVLERHGSNVAGAYGVAGLESASAFGSLGVEVVSGWRALRYDLDGHDVDTLIVEPRLRANMWISPQLTLGAAAGLTLGGHNGWMGGLFLGVHSENFGAWPRSAD